MDSNQYDDSYETPVLTAGKSFILGYTDEKNNIFDNLPIIIFDDFTTSVQFVDFPFKVKSSAMKLLKNTEQADIKYCYYLLKFLQHTPENHKRQWLSATSQNIVELPTIEKQKNIVRKLDKILEVIDNQNKQLELLDEAIKARFMEMFGDLRVNDKGWKYYKLDELTELITDGEHATPKRTTQGIYLLSARNVLNHQLSLEDVDYIDYDEFSRISRRIIPREGDVLISCSGSIGRCCVVPKNIKFQMVRSIALLRFKSNINPVFAEYMITSDYLQDQINKSKTASSQANLFQGKIKSLKGVVPPLELQNQFASFVQEIDKSRSRIQKSLEASQELFDSLMQEYFG
ncbi:MAG: restriction endonuclease subunit S [Catenibacterium mitsuokai]|nr:restriction endonuclease subunit S [Catenibacterium mitsuokai]MEE0334840.1 restriction endonuclease subunit S [Catenibacterium mitsuokai]